MTIQNTSTTASCGKYANAICVTVDNVTIDGQNASGQPAVTFQYGGTAKCASCSGGTCSGPQPALFVLSGSHDVVENLKFNFFAAGVQIDGMDSNVVAAVESDYYCGQAVRIAAGTGHAVRDSVLNGATDPEATQAGGLCYQEPAPTVACTTDTNCPGQQCHCASGSFASEAPNNGSCNPASSGTCFRKALCGLGNAVVVASGAGHLVANNRFTNAQTPVLVSSGVGGSASAEVDDNQVAGASSDLQLSSDSSFKIAKEDVCWAMSAAGAMASASFAGNRVQLCRYGIRAMQGATVHALSNVVTDDYVSAFSVADTSRLTGSLNRMKNNGTLPLASSSDQRGALVVENDVAATVDFGSRSSGGEPGLNVFCGTLPSISDHVPSCPSGSCCGAPVTAQRNCFEPNEPLVDPYGWVDITYDGRVGVDALCADYGLTCAF